ncbi:glycoside hydrolase family 31 protein [[Clostridium] polysaccharolyticum]|uniref:Alpha-glucosidase n=1 Tax=[Clostridium] polysaccharolyticum TaxID=29364 RepID=A0A1I0DW30_9FIRM|nr:TIM-barrel domain-containing protein [[Clostridium] polysaccharolyticum]SET36821.1 alpha-glucosidase [[Clostridium] polysaccharolyticum]
MIQKYSFENSIPTDSVVMDIPVSTKMPEYLTVVKEEKHIIYHMKRQDIVYGLGEATRGINKRGYIYSSNCSDECSHTEEKQSLYGAHNVLFVKGKRNFGLFVDTSQRVTFDIGYTDMDQLLIRVENGGFDLYLVEGESLDEIVAEFRGLIGQSYIAPKWAFGYQQSRWGYKSEEDIRNVASQYEQADMPLEAIYLDIDYMERYKDFTINTETFPQFEQLVSDMKEKGIHLVPIIDAGVKIEKGYEVYEEGVEKGYFCKTEDGEYFTAGVWPGKCHFPDFMDKDARIWFGSKYSFLIDKGIDGFWNDMNEPALFYTDKGVKEFFEFADTLRGENLDIDKVFALRDKMEHLSNNEEDYRSFYHKLNGKMICHDQVHNLYGYFMTRAAREAFDLLYPDREILLFSRASCIGSHRYGGIWTGDNCSWWSHLLLNIKMMPSLNMCGYLYTGADIGGFGCNISEELMIRWIQFGVFTPLFRNHSALGTREQELYRFKNQDVMRNILKLRYSLIPYLYSEYLKAAFQNTMLFRPLAFAYPEDAHCEQVEDELLLGESLLLAPVYEQNARGRYVYLPEKMLCIKYRSLTDMEQTVYEKGHHYIKAGLEECIFFIRPNRLLVLGNEANRTTELKEEAYQVIGFEAEEAVYELWNGYVVKNGLRKPKKKCYTL